MNFGKRWIFNPIGTRDNLAVVEKVLIAPHQNLLTRIGVGGITPDAVMDGRETREGKNRGRHYWNGWVIG